MKKNLFKSLYWRISAVFLIILAFTGFAYVYITLHYSGMYLQETNQRLNRNVAKSIVENSAPFYNGEVIKPALEEMFHHVRAINPSLEVYLVDPKGKIIAWYPPEKKIVLQTIDMAPVLKFINSNGNEFIKGSDPLNPNAEKVFSASPLTMNNMLYAYIYVVLTGEEYQAASDFFSGNYQ